MKKYTVFLVIGFLFLVPKAHAAISFVSASSAEIIGSASSVSSTISAVANDLLVVGCGTANTPPPTSSITDTIGNSFTLATTSINNNIGEFSMFYAISKSTASDVVTCNLNQAGPDNENIVLQYSGVALASPLDFVNATGSTTGGTTFTSLPFTTSQSGDVIVSFGNITTGASKPFHAGTGYTLVTTSTEAASEYDITTSTLTNATSGMTITLGGSAWQLVTGGFIATNPPSISWVSPVSNATVSSIITLTASSTGNGASISSTAFYVGSYGGTFSSSSLIGSTSTPSGTLYSTSWNTNSTANGSSTLWALATDTSNNTSTASTTVNVENPPVISGVASSTSLTTSTITWTTNESASSQVNYGTSTAYGLSTSTASLVTSHSLTLIGLNPNSTYHFQVLSTDAQGNAATSTDAIFKTQPDTTPPLVTLFFPTNNTTVSSTVTISASSTDNVAVAGVQFQIDGVNLGSEVTATSGPTIYSSTWNTTSSTNGTHIISAIAYDTANNTSTATSSVTVSNPAILRVTTSTSLSYSAANGSTATSSQSVIIANTASAGAATLNWSATSTQTWLTFSPASNSLSANATTSVLFIANPTGLGIGTYNATATISDPNASSSPQNLSVAFIINSTGISTSITSPTNGATVTSTITVSAIATSTAGVTSVQFYLDGSAFGSAVTSSPYVIPWNTASSTNSTHTLSTLATDADANTATSSVITVTVNNTTMQNPTPSPPSASVGVSSAYGIPDYWNIRPSAGAVTSSIIPTPTLSAPTLPQYHFTRYLSLGSHGPDVKILQELLNQLGFTVTTTGFGSSNHETQYFGIFTQDAVQRFQAAYGIINYGMPNTTGYGVVGPRTRGVMNGL